jgi:N-acetylglucosamine kinase-like BadF-type ATPase
VSDHELVLGIDGGGSKTVALLADRRLRVRGSAVAGPSNYQGIGFKAACAAIVQAADEACHAAGDVTAPGAVCLGLAGAGRAEDRALFAAWATARWPGARVVVVGDMELVLAAGTPGGWGLALVCGTGSVVYGRDQGGRDARAGGWGPLLGDEGSGYAIGQAALRAVTRAADGRGPPTVLTAAVLGHWSLGEPAQLVPRVYRAGLAPHEVAALAALVGEAAAAGDEVARQILRAAWAELALALAAVARQLDLRGPIPCALAGGLLLSRAAPIEALLEQAAALGLALEPVALVQRPAEGALRIATSL